jgi:glutamyl-tRNA reductase
MDLLIVGINHTTAPIALREKIAFSNEQLGQALTALRSTAGLQELAILSTCNRTEIYAVHKHNEPAIIIDWLADYHQVATKVLTDSVYTYWGHSSVKHLMRVAAGLDSMVLGEPQILGQMKDCFQLAHTHQSMGAELNQLCQNTYRVAKRVRSTTAIGQNPVSIASTAVVLASQLFADLKTCNALLIGAGETIKLVGQHLNNAGVKQLVIANRTLANAQRLAETLNATATELSDIPQHLVHADIVITATGSALAVLGKNTAERALKLRRHKPIFMVDLGVPRDIDPEVDDLSDVYLYSIDDLQEIISTNLSSRQAAALEAEVIVEQAVLDFQQQHRSRQAVDTLKRFRQRHESIKRVELEKALQRLKKGDAPEAILNSLANQLTNKIIHTPSIQLKQASAEGRRDMLSAVEDLYQLGNDDPNPDTETS